MIHDVKNDMWCLSCVPNFSGEDGVILDMDSQYIGFLTCVPNFSSPAWIEVCQEPPSVILGRTLKVPDWSLGGWGHLWCQRSSWKTTIKLSWKFHKDLTSFGWDIDFWRPGGKIDRFPRILWTVKWAKGRDINQIIVMPWYEPNCCNAVIWAKLL